MKTFDDVMRATLAIFPDAELGEDNDGQVVVYTGLKINPGDKVTRFADSEPDTCPDCGEPIEVQVEDGRECVYCQLDQ